MTGRHYTFSSFNKHIYKHGGNTDFVPVRQRYQKTFGSDQSSVRLDLNIYKNWFSIIFFVQFIDFQIDLNCLISILSVEKKLSSCDYLEEVKLCSANDTKAPNWTGNQKLYEAQPMPMFVFLKSGDHYVPAFIAS